MKRIAILGCSGSGKSTLSQKLAKVSGLPVIHLDQEFHLPNWQERSAEEWADIHSALAARERWIIDGCYNRSAAERTKRADLIIWFNIPTHICLYRVIKRIVTNYGKQRSDSAPGCNEQFDIEFLLYVLSFKRQKAPKLLAIFEKRPPNTELVIISNNADIKNLLNRFKTAPYATT